MGDRKNRQKRDHFLYAEGSRKKQTDEGDWYFVKWKGCAEDENTWEPPEGMNNAQDEVERFHRESPEMPGPGEVE